MIPVLGARGGGAYACPCMCSLAGPPELSWSVQPLPNWAEGCATTSMMAALAGVRAKSGVQTPLARPSRGRARGRVVGPLPHRPGQRLCRCRSICSSYSQLGAGLLELVRSSTRSLRSSLNMCTSSSVGVGLSSVGGQEAAQREPAELPPTTRPSSTTSPKAGGKVHPEGPSPHTHPHPAPAASVPGP